MLTDVGPLHVETRGAHSAAERQAALRTRMTPNTLIVLSAIVVLVAALIFLELRIRHLTIASLAGISLQDEFVEVLSAKDFKGKSLTAETKQSWQLSLEWVYYVVLTAPVALRSYFALALIALSYLQSCFSPPSCSATIRSSVLVKGY